MTRNVKLPEIVIGAVARSGAVGVFPLYARTAMPAADYALAATVMASGAFEIAESPERATVGVLEARNRSGKRVLIVEGDHVIGAKQNRMLTSSALVGAGATIEVPASCVEQGRWNGPTTTFAAEMSSMAPAQLRRIAKLSVTQGVLGSGRRAADQSQIWATIAAQQRRLRVSSATSALAHTYAQHAHAIGADRARMPCPDGAIGAAIAIGGEVVSIDVFDRPATLAHYWPRLVDGALLEGLAATDSLRVSGAEVTALLEATRDGAWRRVTAVGDGEEDRALLSTPAAASVLRLDGRIVHLGIVSGSAAPVGVDAVDAAVVRSRPMRAELPPALSRYRIVERIGVGGTKEVFRATDAQGGPDVAVARMPCVDPQTFEHEIAVVRQVRSAYVPQVFDALVDEYGDGYIVMERCTGPSLASLVNGRPLALAEAAPLMIAFARGLAAIHEAHVLHRDVKLENVMLSGSSLKIVDFGLSARAAAMTTAVGVVSLGGTYPYMAPELLLGDRVDARTDVYAFGVCVYRLLTGDFPLPPKDRESELGYMQRLRDVVQHDLSRLPALSDGLRGLIARLLAVDPYHRPYMPEVVTRLVAELGDPPLRAPRRLDPMARPPVPALERVGRIATPLPSPECLLVTGCMQAPLVALSPGERHTEVTAFRGDGVPRWTRRLAGRFTAGMRADLDGDGIREIYLAGPGRLAVLGASGAEKLVRDVPAYAAQPTLIALPSATMPRIAIDGRVFDPATGTDHGLVPRIYEGRGGELVDTVDPRGISYNGHATQAFRGDQGTAAAIVYHPGDSGFLVAHLEQQQAMPRIQLAVYGPGGARRANLLVADGDVATGDRGEIRRLLDSTVPLVAPRHAPIALIDGRTAVVVVPLVGPRIDRAIAPCLVAFELPSGRALWRAEVPGSGTGRAIFADVDGDGRPELVVGDGERLIAYDPWSGAASAPIACTGVPVAFGDPFATGRAHLVTVDAGGIELWRAGDWPCGTMQWTGPRADLWRTGTVRSDGLPLGPL